MNTIKFLLSTLIILSQSPTAWGATDTPMTQATGFANVCSAYTNGYKVNSTNTGVESLFGLNPGPCSTNGIQALFSISHETLQNNHVGDLNHSVGSFANPHMSDYTYARDFGQWVNASLGALSTPQTLAMSLDTINFESNTPTGRSIKNGHMFFGLNDLTAKGPIDQDVYVEFDIRVRGAELNPALYSGSVSGHRVMLGALTQWPEAGRSNINHFTEIDLYESAQYTFNESLNPTFCADAPYDRCFFDPAGKSAEGRNVSYPSLLQHSQLPLNSNTWVHIQVPLSALIRSLGWVSRPTTWSNAQLAGIYIGLESMGASRLWIEVKGYKVYRQTQTPSPLGLPLGLIRSGSAGLISNTTGVCGLSDASHLANWSFTQHDYDVAPQVTLPAGLSIPACSRLTSPFKALFRVGNSAFVQQSNFYCAVGSMSTLVSAGYTQANYDAAPQVFLADKGLLYTGSCK